MCVHRGLLVCSLQNKNLLLFSAVPPFALLATLRTQATVKKMLPFSQPRYLLLGEQEGFIELLDCDTHKVVLRSQLKQKVDVFDLCKTSVHEDEYAVAQG